MKQALFGRVFLKMTDAAVFPPQYGLYPSKSGLIQPKSAFFPFPNIPQKDQQVGLFLLRIPPSGEAVPRGKRSCSLDRENSFSALREQLLPAGGACPRRAARRGDSGFWGGIWGARWREAPLPAHPSCAEMPRFAPFRRDSEVSSDFSRFPLARRAADVVYYAPVRPERRTRSLKVGS